jgi:hypothetical protein
MARPPERTTTGLWTDYAAPCPAANPHASRRRPRGGSRRPRRGKIPAVPHVTIRARTAAKIPVDRSPARAVCPTAQTTVPPDRGRTVRRPIACLFTTAVRGC